MARLGLHSPPPCQVWCSMIRKGGRCRYCLVMLMQDVWLKILHKGTTTSMFCSTTVEIMESFPEGLAVNARSYPFLDSLYVILKSLNIFWNSSGQCAVVAVFSIDSRKVCLIVENHDSDLLVNSER